MTKLYIDLKYAGMLSARLRNFKQFKPGFFRFTHSCESSDSRKTRGYIYPKGEGLNVYCHNCQLSQKLGTFIKTEAMYLDQEYTMEVYKDRVDTAAIMTPPVQEKEPEPIKVGSTDLIFLNTLPDTHPAVQYTQTRKIPKEFLSKIAFVKDFNKFASTYDKVFEKLGKGVPRLIIPYYDKDGSVISYSARAFGKEKPKYIKLTVNPNVENIYGLWRIDPQKPIITLEGQIDAMFIDNAIAVSGADYSKKFLRDNKQNIIICPDQDYIRNPQVANSVKKAIEDGFAVSFLPESIPYKDINDCVVKGGYDPETLKEIIISNSKQGPSALLELIFRRKC